MLLCQLSLHPLYRHTHVYIFVRYETINKTDTKLSQHGKLYS